MTEPLDDSNGVPADESTGGSGDSSEEPPEQSPPERPLSRLADILEQFKTGMDRADDDRVNDRATGGSRLSWEPVTNDTTPSGPQRPTDEDRPSAFQFDLGSALQRLGGPGDGAAPSPEPQNGPTAADALPQRTAPAPAPPAPTPPASEAPLADLPVRGRGGDRSAPTPAAPVEAPTAPSTGAGPSGDAEVPVARRMPTDLPVRRQAPSGSVFDGVAPAPTLPPQPTPAPARTSQPVPSAKAPAPAVAASPAGAPPVAAVPNIPAGALPTLPASVPAASPVMAMTIETAPSTPDLNALRTAQLRAKKNQRKGRVLSRSLMAFVLIGVAVGGALVFGRDYLFSTDWDRSLTPIVDQIQLERGQDFDHAVTLVTQPADSYAETVSELVLGDDWPNDLPEWRALGLVAGDATASSVSAALATNVSAVYEPDADVIHRLAGATDVAPLRIALEEAWVAQMGIEVTPTSDADVEQSSGDSTDPGLLGTLSVEAIVRRAVDAAALEAATGEPTSGVVAESGLPLPIAYELRAGSELGPALLATADLSPSTTEFGRPFPASLVEAFEDDAARAAPASLRAGDIPADPPVALGVDDWGLVWGAKLPASTVDRMSEALTRDSYRTFTRGATPCFVAVFETTTELRGTLLFSALLGWSSNSPVTAQAVTTQLAPTRVQLEACDPGVDAPVPDVGSVDALIARQLARLSS